MVRLQLKYHEDSKSHRWVTGVERIWGWTLFSVTTASGITLDGAFK
jgi:hypothetical protein